MTNPQKTPRELTSATRKIVDLYLHYGDMQQVALRTGQPYDTIRRRILRARKIDPSIPSPLHVRSDDRYPIHDGKSILYKNPDPNDPVQLVWSKGATPKKHELSADQVVEKVEKALSGFRPPKLLVPRTKGEPRLLGIWPLADLHMSMRAWGAETGFENWDTKLATQAYQEGLSEVTSMTPKVKRGVVLVAGDLSHADNYQNQTTNPNTNHLCDVDGRYPLMLEASTDIVLFAVSRALERAEVVEVVVLPGNHDGATAVAVRYAISLYYRNDKRVKVNTSPSRYWWYEWGKCMFGATHGDKQRYKTLGQYMAAAKPEMWGRTKFRHCFTGHYHAKLVEDFPGVRVEILPCPAPSDSWTAEMGYLATRAFETKVYHKDRGLRHTPTVIL